MALDTIQGFLKVPEEVWDDMRAYLAVIFSGIFATFLYNYLPHCSGPWVTLLYRWHFSPSPLF